jgi:hypothetical protein
VSRGVWRTVTEELRARDYYLLRWGGEPSSPVRRVDHDDEQDDGDGERERPVPSGKPAGELSPW